jgi:hypothetical protein
MHKHTSNMPLMGKNTTSHKVTTNIKMRKRAKKYRNFYREGNYMGQRPLFIHKRGPKEGLP